MTESTTRNDLMTGSQAEPGNPCLEALPRSKSWKIGGRASGSALPGRAWERAIEVLK
jgi:hypothetical protein